LRHAMEVLLPVTRALRPAMRALLRATKVSRRAKTASLLGMKGLHHVAAISQPASLPSPSPVLQNRFAAASPLHRRAMRPSAAEAPRCSRSRAASRHHQHPCSSPQTVRSAGFSFSFGMQANLWADQASNDNSWSPALAATR